MSKSIIANWRTASDKTKTFIDTYRTSELLDDDIVDIKYTNFIVTSNADLKIESPTDSWIKDLVDTAGTSEVTYSLDTYQNGATDDRSLNFFALKFNKLNEDFMESLRNLDVEIRFFDQYNNNPVPEIKFTFSKRNPTKAVTATTYTSGSIDIKEGFLYIDHQMLSQLTGIEDRAGSPSDRLFHDSIEIKFTGLTAELSTDYAEISNVTYTNSIDVNLKDGVKPKNKSLDKIVNSLEGKEFIDRHNTKKENTLEIPLMSKETFRLVDKNFFSYFDRQPFFIMPLSGEDERFENFLLGGFLKLKGDYTPARKQTIWSIKFKTIEVI